MASSTGDLEALAASITLTLPNGDSVPITLHKFDQMSKVYAEACGNTGAPEHLVRVWLNDKMLKKTQSANDLGLVTEMLLETEVITEATLDLTVKITGPGVDKTVQLETKNTSTMMELMTLLTVHGCTDEYKLYLGTKSLATNADVLHDLKIASTSTLVAKHGIPEFAAGGKAVEVVFSFDTTGSMAQILEKVRDDIKDLVDRLIKDIPNIKVGLIAHGDYCDYDDYVIKTHELSNDAASLERFAVTTADTYGGDSPECYELVLKTAQQFRWSEDSAKALVVIGDSEPHPPSMTDQAIYWQTELDILCGMDIKVYGVRASESTGDDYDEDDDDADDEDDNYDNDLYDDDDDDDDDEDDRATAFYKELADRSNGAYVKFSNFSLIKNMFLAVCYSEAGKQYLDKYRGQTAAKGPVSDQQQEMFDQLKEMHIASETDRAAGIVSQGIAFDPTKSRNYVATPWFNKALDNGTPQYTYNRSTNTWKPM